MKKGIGVVFAGILIFSVVFSAGLVFADTKPELNILSPKLGEEVPFGKDVVIAISIYDPDGDANIRSIEFEVDGTEITQDAQVSVFLATYPLKDGVKPGRHTFSFSISDNAKHKSTIDGFFNVSAEPEKKRVASANGTIRTGSELDDDGQAVIGILDTYVYGRLTSTIDYSATAYITNENSSNGQGVSSFRLNMFMPYMGLVLGDATPSFSTYTIDGMEVRGVHVLPQFGGFGMELLFGQTLNKVTGTANTTFSQRIYGARIKAGSEEKFLWGLSFLKVKDQTDSLSSGLAEAATTPPPKENLVLGTDFTLSLMDGIFTLEAEANESILNTDITTGATMAENWDWLFTVGNSMVPVIPGLNSLAGRAALKLGPLRGNTFNGEFSYVGKAYNSLANTSITNDRMGGRAWDSLWLLNDMIFLSAGFQYYVNNLQNTEEDTTKTIGTSASAYVYPTDSLSINAGVDLQSVNNNNDIERLNTSVNAGVNQNMDIWITDTNIYLNGNISLLNDEVVPANDANIYSTRLGAMSYFTSFPLDTKLVLGYDFGDTPNSVYMEGRGGYGFLSNENLYTFADVVYGTGIQHFDLTIGVEYETALNLTFEGDFEYERNPYNIELSAYATWEF